MARWRVPVAALAATALVSLTGTARAAELLGICRDDNLCAASEKGKVTPLTKDGASAPYTSPAMSLDGQDVAYLRGGAPYLARARGKGARKLVDTPDSDRIRLSDSGASFAFNEFTGAFGGEGLEFVLFVGGKVGSSRYSSDSHVLDGSFLGEELMLTTNFNQPVNKEVCTVTVVTSTEPPPCRTVVASQPGRSVEAASASPNGKLIVAESNLRDQDTATRRSRSIALFDPATGKRIRELTGGPMDQRPEFSPDGKRVSFTRGADTMVVPVSGGAPRVLVRNFTDADWAGPAGRAVLAKAVLKLKGRTITAVAKCSSRTGCVAARWKLKEKGVRTPFAQFRVAALRRGASEKVTAKISPSKARRVRNAGSRGLKLTLTGAGGPRRVVLRSG